MIIDFILFVCVFQKEIASLLVALNDFHSCFYPMVFLLHLLVHKLPSSPLGKQVGSILLPLRVLKRF